MPRNVTEEVMQEFLRWKPSDGTSKTMPKEGIEKLLHLSERVKLQAKLEEQELQLSEVKRPGLGITT